MLHLRALLIHFSCYMVKELRFKQRKMEFPLVLYSLIRTFVRCKRYLVRNDE